MITRTINSYWIHSKSKYGVWGYNYKSMNSTKSGSYVKGYTNYYICIKFESSSITNDQRNAKKLQKYQLGHYAHI